MRNPTAPSAKLQFGWIGNRFAMGWVDGNVCLISEPQTSCSPSGSRAANSRTTGEFQLIGQSLDRGGRGGHHIERTLEMRLNKKVAVVHGAGRAVRGAPLHKHLPTKAPWSFWQVEILLR
jgi:hypothetical protein